VAYGRFYEVAFYSGMKERQCLLKIKSGVANTVLRQQKRRMFPNSFIERPSLLEDICAYNVKDVFASPLPAQSLLCGALVWCDVM
jgi:hypothetical protein